MTLRSLYRAMIVPPLLCAVAMLHADMPATRDTAPAPHATTKAQTDAVPTALFDYVERADATYAYDIRDEIAINGNRGYVVRMTSQTWQDTRWEHWLSIIVPPEIRHRDKAILLIGGGSSRSRQPDGQSNEAKLLTAVAAQCGAVVAVIEQVPNQPLFGDLKEDALIAYTFEKYLRGEGDDWPLLLPMVKSAVRAMDTVTAVGNEKLDLDIDKFVVMGASKRGWTTYLTAAVDERVIAIAPLVFDTLNLGAQMKQQVATYGDYSDKVGDYTERGIQKHMDTPRGRRLTAIVDPYTYRERLTMPKLVVLGTNDPYWTVDSSSLYFDELVGEKHLYYEANAGHRLGPGIVPTIMQFINSVLNDTPMRMIDWSRQDDGTLHVQWQGEHCTAVLCQAHSENRDFRQAQWTRTTLEGDGACVVEMDEPDSGYTAFYVEIVHNPPGGLPYRLSTTIQVTPQRFVHGGGE